MDDRELEDILIGTLETRIDHQIEKIDEIISDSEEFADLSIDIWPPKMTSRSWSTSFSARR